MVREVWWPRKCEHKGSVHAFARITTLDGEFVGIIEVPFTVFLSEIEVEAEFILLSVHKIAKTTSGDLMHCSEDNTADKLHVPGCQYAQNVNIMMIQWNEDKKVAYRVALGRVSEPHWAQVKTELKEIVLG